MSESRKRRQNSGLRTRSGSGEIAQRSTQQNRGKMNHSSQSKNNFQRQGSYDRVRKIVQEEGRSARNLIQWNVPVDSDDSGLNRGNTKPAHPSPRSPARRPAAAPTSAPVARLSAVTGMGGSGAGAGSGGRPGAVGRGGGGGGGGGQGERESSSLPGPAAMMAVGRGSGGGSIGGSGRKGDLRARYWAFLFENLRRAVDEIYQTCEADESVVECKEVIMMLEQCTKDFKSLIERLQLLEAYDNAEEGQKPTSLAWEVRKSSPGKGLQPATAVTAKDHVTPSTTVVRSLNFNPQEQSTGNSWADKVKGSPPVVASSVPSPKGPPPATACASQAAPPDTTTIPGITALPPADEDQDGWETVQRGGRVKGRNGNGQGQSQGHSHREGHGQKNVRISETSGSGGTSSKPVMEPAPDKHTTTSPKHTLIRSHSGPPELVPRAAPHPTNPDSILNQLIRCGESEKENQPISAQQQNNLRNRGASASPPVTGVRSGPPAWGRATTVLADPPHTERGTPDDSSLKLARSSKPAWNLPATKSLDRIDDLTPLQGDSDAQEEGDFHRGLSPVGKATSGLCLTRPAELDADDDDFSSDDERERDDAEEKLTQELEKELKTVEKMEEELEKEQEQWLEEATREEQSYLKEIERERNTEIIVDTEPETDGELGGTNSSADFNQQLLNQSVEANVKQTKDPGGDQRKTLCWADMMDMMDEPETRTPGRVVHMHEKLSSPSRKRSLTESRKRSEEKQKKAREQREKLNSEKAERLHTLTGKVEEVRSWKDELMQQRKMTIERKMQRAEEKRQLQLRQKIRKAHEEEKKANEIAFINTLEAQNKRHDIITKHQEVETRLQDLQEERQRKHEEKAAKEAAVEERRKALEAERVARLQEMQDRRRQRATEFEQRQQTRERERLEAARAKERTREERIAVLNAQQQAHIEELQKKIQQKQDESARRHKENLENIREKAFEMSVLKHSTEDHNDAPKLVPYLRKKVCNVCNILIPSEVYLMSHLRGRKHQMALRESGNGQDLSKSEIEAFNLAHIEDAPSDKPDPQLVSDRERQKALKKRCKKLRQRMTQRGSEYESSLAGKQQTVESEHRVKLQKVVKDLNKYLSTQDSGPWAQSRVSALDRALGEITRILEKRVSADQTTFRLAGGLTTLSRVLLVVDKSSAKLPPVVPIKSLCHTSTVFRLACKGCYDNCHYMLFSNKVGALVDLLSHQLNMLIPDNFGQATSTGGVTNVTATVLPFDPLASSLMQLIASILNCLAKNNPLMSASEASAERMSSSGDSFSSRASDIISYIVSVGVVDRLAQYFTAVRGSIDDNQQGAEFLQHSLALLTSMIKLVSRRNANIFEECKVEDASQLMATFRMTEIVGIMSLLYGMLLHTGAPPRSDQAPPKLPQHTIAVTTMAIKMLNTLATVHLHMFQATLGAEGTSLELRHIVAYLAWYCGHWTQEELLHEVIMCVGYFTVLNQENQVFMQSGQPPTVLQQLCLLPFRYFSDPSLTGVLFPTLIACCYRSHGNREILQQELSCDLLANFIEVNQESLHSEKQLEAQAKATKAKTIDKDSERLSLSARFPVSDWDQAKEYFKHRDGDPTAASS